MDQHQIHEAAMKIVRAQEADLVVEVLERLWTARRLRWELRDGSTVAAAQIATEPHGARWMPETPILVFLDEDDFETGDSIYEL